MLTRLSVAICLFTILWFPLDSFARIKLTTLPVRERVEIQLDHETTTLVEEERYVPLLRGDNQIDFAWANTSIDPDSIVFRVLEPAGDAVQVLSVSYPPNEQALVWHISAQKTAAARVRISYVLNHLSKSFSHRALTATDEQSLQWTTDVRVDNQANEAFENAQVWTGIGAPTKIDIGLNQSQQWHLTQVQSVPVEKTYTADVQTYGYLKEAQKKLSIPMHYVLHNKRDHQLGDFALPYGKVRIFQKDSQGGSAFIGEDWGAFTPLDGKLKLFLGTAQDVVVKRHIAQSEQQRVAGRLFNHKLVIKYDIENFKTQAVTLDIVENLREVRNMARGYTDRDVEWVLLDETTLGKPDAEAGDFEQLVFHLPLPPRTEDGQAKKQTVELAVLFKNEW